MFAEISEKKIERNKGVTNLVLCRVNIQMLFMHVILTVG